jgi:3-hydroxyisobutyrate dehydrogenase-like beta-hydroxyacid dehydrogenase
MVPLIAQGARPAETVADAVRASRVLLVCLTDFRATNSLLGPEDVSSELKGRTVIELSSGNLQEGEEFAAWLHELGASCLDGAILGAPYTIGTDRGQILLAGPTNTFEQVESVMSCLGTVRYLGANIRAAGALSLAWTCQRFGLFVGLAHGALLCESEGLDCSHYASLFPDGDRAQLFANVVASDDYNDPAATLNN